MHANPEERPTPAARARTVRPARPARLAFRWDRRRFAMRIGHARTSGWRLAAQVAFTFVSIAIGIQFAGFVDAARRTTEGPLPVRPPGIEGYLPISGLMGALDWVYQGTLNAIHPAATILFLTFVAVSWLLRKSFCGWICPVGLLSESLARLGLIGVGRNPNFPRWLDIPLRGLKYLLLAFFLWAIFTMPPAALRAFIESPYNKISDVKMLEFFVRLSTMAGIVIGSLALLSVFVQGFWCRYLCPYGALLGLFSRFSPVRVRRDPAACTDCGICDRACPARLPVSRRMSIASEECIGCTDCVVSCPVPGALRFGTRRRSLSPLLTGALVVGIFLAATLAARAGGIWHSGLTDDEIRYHIGRMDGPDYGHPGR